jgi:hypothetical protein
MAWVIDGNCRFRNADWGLKGQRAESIEHNVKTDHKQHATHNKQPTTDAERLAQFEIGEHLAWLVGFVDHNLKG